MTLSSIYLLTYLSICLSIYLSVSIQLTITISLSLLYLYVPVYTNLHVVILFLVSYRDGTSTSFLESGVYDTREEIRVTRLRFRRTRRETIPKAIGESIFVHHSTTRHERSLFRYRSESPMNDISYFDSHHVND